MRAQKTGPQDPQLGPRRIPRRAVGQDPADPRFEHQLRGHSVGGGDVPLDRGVRGENDARLPGGLPRPRAEAKLQAIYDRAGGFRHGAPQAGLGQEAPGIVLRAANRAPHERRVELPEIARFAKAAHRQVVNEVEVQLRVRLLCNSQRAAVPAPIEGIIHSRNVLQCPFPALHRHKQERQPGRVAVALEIVANGRFEFVLFANDPRIAKLGDLQDAVPTDPRFGAAVGIAGEGEDQNAQAPAVTGAVVPAHREAAWRGGIAGRLHRGKIVARRLSRCAKAPRGWRTGDR